MTTRRDFIAGAAAGAAAACPLLKLAGAYAPGQKPVMSFGAVSDLHVRISKDGKGLSPTHDCSAFQRALEWFRDVKADAVMVAGDLADTGLVPELEAVAATWRKVFPGNKAADGRHVEPVIITGNHDWDAWDYDGFVFVKELYPDEDERNRMMIYKDLKGNWERIMQEPYVPIFRKDVKGYSFVGAHWQNERCHPKCETAFRHVPQWFDEHGAELDPSKPFFFCQHAHLQNTVYGPWAWGHDSGETTAALSKYPNAVAFSGHSHYVLTDERSIWQGAFTSVGTASLRACTTPGDEFGDAGVENAWGGLNAYKAMEPLPETGQHGYLVRVFKDAIAFSRRDFSTGRMLGGDWVMPLPAAKSKPFSFAGRLASQKPPAFKAGATLSVAKVKATIRGGKAKVDGKKLMVASEAKDAVELTFPQASAVRETRPFVYEATFAPSAGEQAVKRIFAKGVVNPDGDYWTGKPEKIVVALDRLPAAPLKIEVRAISTVGAKSAPLKGELA